MAHDLIKLPGPDPEVRPIPNLTFLPGWVQMSIEAELEKIPIDAVGAIIAVKVDGDKNVKGMLVIRADEGLSFAGWLEKKYRGGFEGGAEIRLIL